MASFLIVAGCSAVLIVIGLGIRRYAGDSPPLWVAALYFTVVVVAGGPAVVRAAMGFGPSGSAVYMGSTYLGSYDVGGYGFPMVRLCAALLLIFPPVAMSARLLVSSATEALFEATHGSRFLTPHPSDFSRARALAVNGDLHGAIREYRIYFEENPKSPRPLFAAASMLIGRSRADEAATMYREIMMRFESSAPIWAEAAYGLAQLLAREPRSRSAASKLLLEITERAPHLEAGRLAAEWLRRGAKPARLERAGTEEDRRV